VIYGDGRQSRDFVFVSDVVEALVGAATARSVNRTVLNIGSGQETTVLELITELERCTGKHTSQVWNREKSGGVRRLVADISLAEKLLNYRPRVSLKDGLDRMMKDDPRFALSL
jgi:UDP-glucose 4-epimerase